MSNFPLCKRVGIEIYPHAKQWENTDWVMAKHVEEMLAKAPVVYAEEYNVVNVKEQYEKMGTWFHNKEAGIDEPNYRPPTHTARLVMIEPIQKDSAESLLREFVQIKSDNLPTANRLEVLLERAKALFSKGGG